MVVLTLVQAGGGEMQNSGLAKAMLVFPVGQTLSFSKNPKRRHEQSPKWKSFQNEEEVGQLGRAGTASYTEVSWFGTGFRLYQKGRCATLLFVQVMLSHKHALRTCILIQEAVFILGINQLKGSTLTCHFPLLF